jgi:tripartite-type tricarboxylate transporter receptor subunit TctC
MPFDAERDLDGVARVVSSQLALVAHPSVAPNNVRELVAWAKARPAGSVSYASAGTGSPQHIGGELLNAKAGIKLNHVPYKGAVPALQDLLGGHVPLAIVHGELVGGLRADEWAEDTLGGVRVEGCDFEVFWG